MFESKMKLGELLIEKGLVSDFQLEKALDQQRLKYRPLGDILVSMGVISEETLATFLSEQFNYPCIPDMKNLIEPDSTVFGETLFTENFMLQHLVMPLHRKGGELKVVIANPLDVILIDNLKAMTSYEIIPFIAGKSLLEKSIMAYFEKSKEVESLDTDIDVSDVSLDKIMAEASEGQVVRIVNLLIIQAVTDLASDIHFEPMANDMAQVRYRIDGELIKVPSPPSNLYLAIVSRIKILARLDISEKRLPQDGAIMMNIEHRNIDFRVSTIPTIYGEKVVIRILDKGTLPLDIDSLGLSERSIKSFKKALDYPYGLMLVTGPTGSGKTTTLYACLNYLRSNSKNLITLEDPVEYKLEGVNQVSVRHEIGLDFAMGLRAFLRQDPDVIMLGEIRDLETAMMSVQAALTGHFVLSTLHTNNAIQALDRLINMKIDPVLCVSSLVLIVAQRLIRKLCEKCKEEYLPSEQILERLEINNRTTFFKPVGCSSCNNRGYKGRLPLHETILLDDEFKSLVSKKESTVVLRRYLLDQGMVELREEGLEKAAKGLTSLEEVLSVTV
ncbi:hypothetical protein AB834_04505 [PVC group bacterium (ex Bugula neritina AB1)]|nr:hypothetical protein AB834_04505 [PVC group bacterium (ex Bugula neritina AB1)]